MDTAKSWASSLGVRASMRSNKGRDTAPELAVRRELHRRGYRFFVNRRPVPSLRRTADILFPTWRIAVFIDGCFWHGCPAHHTVAKTNAEFWASKVEANRRRDAATNTALAEADWEVVRIWEHVPTPEAVDLIVERLSAENRRARTLRQAPR